MFLNCLVALEKVTAPSFFQVHAFSLFQKPNLSSIFVNSFFIPILVIHVVIDFTKSCSSSLLAGKFLFFELP